MVNVGYRWTFDCCQVTVTDFDHDLKQFEVTNREGHFIDWIVPEDVETMELIANDLHAGHCPVCEQWENGLGDTVGGGR